MKNLLVILMVSLLSAAAYGGTIFVSGDSNIGNAIDGSASAPPGDNAIFFKNILGGGTKVVLRTTTNGDTATEVTSQTAIVTYYSGLAGVTVSTFGAPVTSADLAGANLFIGFLPDVGFSAAETAALSAFVSGGGTVLLTGEWVPFDPGADSNINALLAALGSPLSISPAGLDLGFHTATGGQIAADPFTAGISSFVYAATSGVTGGIPLFFTTDGTPFVEYTTTAIPEPSSLLLLGTGLVGAAGAIRRRLLR